MYHLFLAHPSPHIHPRRLSPRAYQRVNTHEFCLNSSRLRPVSGGDLEAELLQCGAAEYPGSDYVIDHDGDPTVAPHGYFGQMMNPPTHPFSSVL